MATLYQQILPPFSRQNDNTIRPLETENRKLNSPALWEGVNLSTQSGCITPIDHDRWFRFFTGIQNDKMLVLMEFSDRLGEGVR